MERHDTHLLSCGSSVEHSYKFDKNGNIFSDSVSELSYFNLPKKNKYKINAKEIFENLNNNLISQEENININQISKEISKNSNINLLKNDNKLNIKENFKIKENNNDNFSNKNKDVKDSLPIIDEENNSESIKHKELKNKLNNNNSQNSENINYMKEEKNSKIDEKNNNRDKNIKDLNINSQYMKENNINLLNKDNNISISQIIKDKNSQENSNKINQKENGKNLENNKERNGKIEMDISEKNISKYSKNIKINENKNNYRIIESNESISYLPFEKHNLIKEKIEIINKNKIKNNIIKKEANFAYSVKKYDYNLLKKINKESFSLFGVKQFQKEKLENKNLDQKLENKQNEEIIKDNLIEDKIQDINYNVIYRERMKFSSKANSFLSSINNIIKEQNIIKENFNIEKNFKLPINKSCFILKSPLILKYKKINATIKNDFCFYTKEIIDISIYKNKIINRKNNRGIKGKKIKESIMLSNFNNNNNHLDKLFKNKFKLNENNQNNINTGNNIDKLLKEKISIGQKNDNNDYDMDVEEIGYFNKESIKNNFNHENMEYDIKFKNYKNHLNDENNFNINDEIKPNNINNKITNCNNFENCSDITNYFNKEDNNEFPKNTNQLLLSPKNIIRRANYNILKPINILKSKKHNIPNSAFPTPNLKNKEYSSNINKFNNYSKYSNRNMDIKSPSTIRKKRLFNDSNLTIKNEGKKNRNRSLLDIINHKDDINDNIIKNSKIKEIPNNYCHHLEELKSNSKNKYNRHFGNEESCPICVALQIKNKLLEDQTKVLPILTKNNIRKYKDSENNKSPNKNKIMKTINPKNKEKRIMRTGSETSIITNRKKNSKRNESVKQIRKIEINNDYQNEEEKKFPIIKDYFNLNNDL